MLVRLNNIAFVYETCSNRSNRSSIPQIMRAECGRYSSSSRALHRKAWLHIHLRIDVLKLEVAYVSDETREVLYNESIHSISGNRTTITQISGNIDKDLFTSKVAKEIFSTTP